MATLYIIYAQFNAKYEGKSGYIGKWVPGHYPFVIPLNEKENFGDITYFPSKEAASAYADRLKKEFEDSIKYIEIVTA